jgi:hypothetical protein
MSPLARPVAVAATASSAAAVSEPIEGPLSCQRGKQRQEERECGATRVELSPRLGDAPLLLGPFHPFPWLKGWPSDSVLAAQSALPARPTQTSSSDAETRHLMLRVSPVRRVRHGRRERPCLRGLLPSFWSSGSPSSSSASSNESGSDDRGCARHRHQHRAPHLAAQQLQSLQKKPHVGEPKASGISLPAGPGGKGKSDTTPNGTDSEGAGQLAKSGGSSSKV